MSLAAEDLFDGHERYARAGTTRVIGIEIKVRHNFGPVVELGMWVPERELTIPSIRHRMADTLEFPCTVHTLHGDLNFQGGGRVL